MDTMQITNPDQLFAYKNLSDKELMKHVFKSGAKGFVKTTVGRRDGSNEIDGTPNLVLLRGREFLAQKLADVPQSSDVDQRNYRIRSTFHIFWCRFCYCCFNGKRIRRFYKSKTI